MLKKFFTKAPAPIESLPPLAVQVAGARIGVAVRRNPRARRMTLRVRAASRDVVLTLPARVTMHAARDFLDRHAGWIEARLAKLPQGIAFVPGAEIPLRGVPHLIAHRAGRGVARVEAGEPPLIVVHGQPEHVARRVTDLLKAEALGDLRRAVARHAAALDVAVTRVAIKDTRSRWGSCSSTGALAFSWRLVMAPPHVLEYLAAHEVAHRREMNHGPRFWRLVRQLDPRMDDAEAWLKTQGASLHRYGVKGD